MAPALGRAQQQATPQIDQLMTAVEFRQAGLTKLTPDEIASLSVWLSKFARAVAQVATDGNSDGSSAATIESQIDGDFKGWEGQTIFKLRNGQIWQQAAFAYHYHYAYAPKILIYKSGVGHLMRVDGVDQPVAVKRLK